MKKTLIKIVIVLCIIFMGIVVMDKYGKKQIYDSQDNVFREIHYSAQEQSELPPLSILLGSSRSLRSPDTWVALDINTIKLKREERLSLYILEPDIVLLEYRKQLPDKKFLFITHTYSQNKLIQNVELGKSDISREFVLQFINHLKCEIPDINISIEDVYQDLTSLIPESFSPTPNSVLVSELANAHIEISWIKNKADNIMNDILLATWFEKGSQRYSVDNLGNVEVVKQIWQ